MPRRSKSKRVTRKLIVYAEMAAVIGLVLGVFGMMFIGGVLLLEVL